MNNALKKYIEYNIRPAIKIHRDYSPKPKLYADTTQELILNFWDGNRDDRGNPVMVPAKVKKGQTLRAVMCSRMGDIGWTDDLDATNGYQIRIDFENDKLENYRDHEK